jgi:hypothetical protein
VHRTAAAARSPLLQHAWRRPSRRAPPGTKPPRASACGLSAGRGCRQMRPRSAAAPQQPPHRGLPPLRTLAAAGCWSNAGARFKSALVSIGLCYYVLLQRSQHRVDAEGVLQGRPFDWSLTPSAATCVMAGEHRIAYLSWAAAGDSCWPHAAGGPCCGGRCGEPPPCGLPCAPPCQLPVSSICSCWCCCSACIDKVLCLDGAFETWQTLRQ